MRDPLCLLAGELMGYHTFIATDKNGTQWYAVHEPMFGGWCAMTRGDILHSRMSDLVSAERARVLLPTVQRELPKFEWSIARFV